MKASPARILLGLVLGAVLGYLCMRSRSPAVRSVPALLAPLGTLFINAIRVCVLPLVTSSLIVGCAASRDSARIGRLAGRSLVVVLGYLAVSAVFAGALAVPLLRFVHRLAPGMPGQVAASAVVSPTPGFDAWLGDLLPANLFKAAAEGALLPLIVLSVLFGIALSSLPADRRDVLVGWFRAMSEAFTHLIDVVLRTAPIGVFCLSANLAAATGLGGTGALVGYVAVLSLVSAAFVLLVIYPTVAVFAPVPFPVFLRGAAPAQALAFTSRSSLAALPATYQAAHESLAIPEGVASFFFPFAASIFRVGGCMAQMVGVCFLASFYGVPLSGAQLATLAVSAVAISLTVPGIPGGAIIVMTPLLASVGVPLGGMAMLLAVDTIPDMFRTTANVTGWLAAGTILSRSGGASAPRSRDHAERDPRS